MSTVLNGIDLEREEVNWLLTSGVLGRSHNLAHMLAFLCQKHFDGKADQITEHTVAIEALGRRSDFDPQVDTIVRVTAHLLRKRLQEIYQGPGAERPVCVLIPPGQYAPSFLHQNSNALEITQPTDSVEAVPLADADYQAVPQELARRSRWLIPGLVGLAAIVLAGVVLLVAGHRRAQWASIASSKGAAKSVSGRTVRALLGNGREPYVDHSGNTWAPGNYCIGGDSIAESAQNIMGTEDPYIFLGGVRGTVHCVFPVDPGTYEVHLLFAENSTLPEATNRAVFFLNGSDGITLDVVDDAEGNGTATTKVFRGVHPENDDSIHLDYISEISLLKAVEIIPTPTEAMLPIRIVASSKPYTDPEGHIWYSDRYFIGGRRGRVSKFGKSDGTGIYAYQRIGHFRYILPVVPLEKYRVRLYFQEHWFGKQSSSPMGPRSRVFDVWCNGVSLLKNFDLVGEAGLAPIVKTFDNLQATAQGKIELSFTPVINYALIDAIEVSPEPSQ
ncbi:MAG TPA: malectin domain-containing carbohydrate-binding protein [Acidisarcina sp.]|nr:malectin domain-containing carbohydrate-binding protein [Acidisarcina sp.]